MTQNQKTVAKYMDGFNKFDHEQILSCLTDDVAWDMPGVFHLSGKVAFDKEIENEAFVGRPLVMVTRMMEENDIVAVEGTVHVRRKTGGVLNAAFCDVFDMEQGKIKHLTSYLLEEK